MLQQILDDMFVEPELLVELDEEQKQLLFCKMREEQVRRWKLREELYEKNPPTKPKKQGGKKVTFLVGCDGEPVVVVLGGGRDDVDTLLHERARRQAELEADVIKKAAEEELDKLVRLSRSTVQAMEKDATRQQQLTIKENNPTRNAVVKSLQEATQEMEKHIQSLDKVDESKETPAVPLHNEPPTPPPSPPNKTTSTPSIGSLVTALPAVTIAPYGSTHPQPIKKIQTSLWTGPQTKVNGTSKSAITNSKNSPAINGFASTLSSCSSTISPPSSLSSNSSRTPSPPLTNSPTCLLSEEESGDVLKDMPTYRKSSTQQDIEDAEKVALGVADQIRRWEQLSEGSLEALKTATLERAKKRRQKEIFEHLKLQVDLAKQQAVETARLNQEKEEEAWVEQERKAKEAERRIREIARRAREEHRRTSIGSAPSSPSTEVPQAINPNLNGVSHEVLVQNGLHGINGFNDFHPLNQNGKKTVNGDINGNIKNNEDSSNNNLRLSNGNSSSSSSTNSICSTSSSGYNSSKSGSCVRQKLRPAKPPSKESIVNWFREEELPKGTGLDASKSNVAPWFHGIISRVEAEEILQKEQVGSFLVRVSERIWGYAISYRAIDRCRHYLIDATGGTYTFLGSHQASHSSLGDLVEHHRKEPITASGGELLRISCGQSNPKRPDHLELFTGTQYLTL